MQCKSLSCYSVNLFLHSFGAYWCLSIRMCAALFLLFCLFFRFVSCRRRCRRLYSFITSFISVWHNIFRGMLLWYMHFTNLYRVLSMDIGTSSTLKIRILVFVLTHSRTWQKKKTFTRAHVLIWDLGVDIALNRIKCCCRHSMERITP